MNPEFFRDTDMDARSPRPGWTPAQAQLLATPREVRATLPKNLRLLAFRTLEIPLK